MILPNMIVGVMRWGEWGAKFSTSQMSEMIDYCYNLGLSTFDHADIYGHYSTEEAFGLAFQKTGIQRDKIQLISKCGIKYPGERTAFKIKHYDYDSAYVISCAERSLKMLKTDYLDVFLLHRPSSLMHAEEVAKAIEILKKSGKIKSFGVSNFGIETIRLLQGYVGVDHQQIEISLTASQSLTNGMLDFLKQQNILTMAWNPLGNFLTGTHPNNQKIESAINILTQKYQTTTDALLLAWLMRHPNHIIPVIGTTKKERIIQQLSAPNIKLDLEDWFALWEAANGNRVP